MEPNLEKAEIITAFRYELNRYLEISGIDPTPSTINIVFSFIKQLEYSEMKK